MRAKTDLVFSALADPTRRRIFERLVREGEQSVRALTDHAGISQPAVSRHLSVLKRARLVSDRKKGRETHYGVRAAGMRPLVDWMAFYSGFWQARFAALKDLLRRMDI